MDLCDFFEFFCDQHESRRAQVNKIWMLLSNSEVIPAKLWIEGILYDIFSSLIVCLCTKERNVGRRMKNTRRYLSFIISLLQSWKCRGYRISRACDLLHLPFPRFFSFLVVSDVDYITRKWLKKYDGTKWMH